MRAVVSRVTRAAVTVDGAVVGELAAPGLLVLLGVHRDDPDDAAVTMARKLHELRLLREERSCADTGAGLLVVSQFTLHGDTRKGRRPSWSAAAPGPVSEPLYEAYCTHLRDLGAHVEQGVFGAMMAVELTIDGPFTVLLET